MPILNPSKAPKYRLHRPSNRAVVTFNSRDIYLGEYESTESKTAYNRLVTEWKANSGQLPSHSTGQLLVDEVIAMYWQHAELYYRTPTGEPSSEIESLKAPLKLLRRLYGDTQAAEFGPLKLDALRSEMIRMGWGRRSINRQIGRLKRVFKWAVSRELVPATVFHGVSTVAGLKAGRSDARETDPIRPVSDEVIEATLPHLSTVVAAMVRVQRLTGSRSGEICIIRTGDIDTTGPVWVYKPSHHKNAYRGHQRFIHIGPKAQAVLEPFMKPLNPTAFIFSPTDAVAEMRERRHATRQTPERQGNTIGSARRSTPKRKPGLMYNANSLQTAIRRGCIAAFPPPAPLAKLPDETTNEWKRRLTTEQKTEYRAWMKNHHWHAHQLRHSAATEVRKSYGLESAQQLLGHSSASVTEIYAERDRSVAAKVALQVG